MATRIRRGRPGGGWRACSMFVFHTRLGAPREDGPEGTERAISRPLGDALELGPLTDAERDAFLERGLDRDERRLVAPVRLVPRRPHRAPVRRLVRELGSHSPDEAEALERW